MSGPGAESLRDGLRGQDPPWYDPASDGWRRIEVRDPEPPRVPDEVAVGVGALAWTLLAALVVAGVLALAWAWLSSRAARRPAAPAAPAAAGGRGAAAAVRALPQGAAGGPGGLDPALAAGDWPAAVACLYARALLRLDAAGALRLLPGITDGGCRRQVAAWAGGSAARRPALAGLAALGDAVMAVHFGHRPIVRAEVERLLALDRAAEAALAGEGA